MSTRDGSRWRAPLVALALASSGCFQQTRYLVEMTPRPSGLERRVTVTCVVDSGAAQSRPMMSPDQAGRLAAAYGAWPDTTIPPRPTHPGQPPGRTSPYEVRRVFRDVPDDLGNWGTLRHDQSILGSSWTYAERIRGDVDPATTIAHRLAAADSLADLVLGWTASELAGHPRWGGLKRLVEDSLRLDLRNAAVLLWLAGAGADSSGFARVGVDLEEHRVIQDLLTLVGSLDLLPRAAAVADLRDRFARAMALRSPAETRRTLGFLSDPDSVERSMARYMAGITGESAEEAKEGWGGVIGRMLGTLWPSVDPIEVRLAVPVQPYETNGVWDAALGRVTWRGEMSEDDPLLPFACFAQWSIPDSIRQRRIFGSTLVSNDDLGKYDRWFAVLSTAKQQEWDRMLLGLKPGDLRPLERFRFTDEKAGRGAAMDSTAGSLADTPRELILDAARRHD